MILVPVFLVGLLAGVVWAADGTPPEVKPAPQPPAVWATDDGVANYMIAAVADLQGNLPVAAQGYARALSRQPESMMLRHRLFEVALMNGDTDTALRLARSFPEIQQDTLTRLVQVLQFVKEGQLPKAKTMLAKTTKLAPDLLQFKLMEDYVALAQGAKPARVMKKLEVSQSGALLAPWRDYHLARMALKAKNPARALKLLERARKGQPQSLIITLLLGQVQALQGHPEAAARLYAAYREANPSVALLVPASPAVVPNAMFASTLEDDLAATLFDFGLLVWGEGALMPARQLMNLAVGLAPQNPLYRFYAGMLLEMGSDLTGALTFYEPLTAADQPDRIRLAATIRQSEVMFRLGEPEKAWNTLQTQLKTHPEDMTLHRSLAQMAFSRKDFETAVQHYSYVLNTLPEGTPANARVELLFARGAAYERGHHITKATRDLQAALVLAPTHAQVLNYLGYMWIEQGLNIDEAFALLKRAHLLAPTDASITDSLGWAYYLRGQYDVAQVYLLRAAELDPRSPEILSHLGDAYAKLNRQDEARREWRRATDLLDAGEETAEDGLGKTLAKKLKEH